MRSFIQMCVRDVPCTLYCVVLQCKKNVVGFSDVRSTNKSFQRILLFHKACV